MAKTAQRPAKIAGQCPDIGALAAFGLEDGMIGIGGLDQVQPVDPDRAGLQFHRLAVPGEITSSLSSGTNALLRLGATPATCAGDVLEALGIERRDAAPRLPTDPVAQKVLSALASGAGTADELSRSTGIGAPELATALALLELAGAVVVDEGMVRSTIAR